MHGCCAVCKRLGWGVAADHQRTDDDSCVKTTSAGKTVFDDGPARTWVDDATGQTRAACVFKPVGTSAVSKRPLLVYLHGSGGSASAIYDSTLLRAKAASFNLSADPGRLGFILVADQGRNLTNSNGNPASPHHEFYLRDLKSPSSSADIRSLDRLIDQVVAEGGVDEKRIYVTGWSNGAFFGQLYSIARHTTATPGGNKVAAVAVFDGANPFVRPNDNDAGCDYRVLPKAALPVMLVHRACSIVPCDEAQRTALGGPPGFAVTEWAESLRTKVGAVDVTQLTLNGMGVRVTSCPAAALCSEALAKINHVRWPDGVADGSGKDWEVDMLDYLRGHPLR